MAAGAILAVAVLTRETPLPNADPSAAPASTPAASAAAVVIPSTPVSTPLVVPPRNPAATPHPTLSPVPAAAGSTELRPAGATPTTRITLTLPAGWHRVGDHMLVKDGGLAPGGASVSVWRVASVEVFPCRWTSPLVAAPSQMATAQGQAVALSSWWGQDAGRPPRSNVPIAPVSTRPEPTTFAGRPAWEVGMLVLSGFDMTACDADQLVFWETASGDVRYGLGPGELHRMWIIDIDGEVIVIDTASYRATSPDDSAELERLIASIVLDR